MDDELSMLSRPPRRPLDSSTAFVVLAAVVAALSFAILHNYLLFHVVVELFTISVALSIFFVAWNARRLIDNHYLLLVGISSLFVGGIDLLHMLAFKGMGVFPDASANLPTQLWIAGRYLHSLALLAAPLFVRRRLPAAPAFGVLAVLTAGLVASIFGGVFPDCFVEGAGLTPFKILSEYAIVAALLAGAILLLRRRGVFDPIVLAKLLTFIFLTTAAELAFTLYVQVDGLANAAGHLLRFVAFWFLYRAIVVTGLVRPYDLLYRNLAQSREALQRSDERYRAFVSNSAEAISRIELDVPVAVSAPLEEQVRDSLRFARILECNDAFEALHGRHGVGHSVGKRFQEALTGSEPDSQELVRDFIESGYRSVQVEAAFPAADGSRRCVAGSFTGIVEDGRLVRVWGVERDITERKRAAEERERLIAELQSALAEVRTLSGLLPICANCKKIRDDRGYWTQVESYLGAKANISFSHGICPDCLVRLYPDYSSSVLE